MVWIQAKQRSRSVLKHSSTLDQQKEGDNNVGRSGDKKQRLNKDGERYNVNASARDLTGTHLRKEEAVALKIKYYDVIAEHSRENTQGRLAECLSWVAAAVM